MVYKVHPRTSSLLRGTSGAILVFVFSSVRIAANAKKDHGTYTNHSTGPGQSQPIRKHHSFQTAEGSDKNGFLTLSNFEQDFEATKMYRVRKQSLANITCTHGFVGIEASPVQFESTVLQEVPLHAPNTLQHYDANK